MVVNILLCSPRATTEDESSALTPYYFLLAPYCLLLLFENGAKRFRVSTSGLDAFRVPRQWVFVNGAKRRFVFARSAKPLPLGVRWPRQRIGNGVGGMDATNGTDNLQYFQTQNLSPKPRTISTPSRDTIARGP